MGYTESVPPSIDIVASASSVKASSTSHVQCIAGTSERMIPVRGTNVFENVRDEVSMDLSAHHLYEENNNTYQDVSETSPAVAQPASEEKRMKFDDETSSKLRHSKRRWTERENAMLFLAFGTDITNKTMPSGRRLLELAVKMKHSRTVAQIRTQVNNYIKLKTEGNDINRLSRIFLTNFCRHLYCFYFCE